MVAFVLSGGGNRGAMQTGALQALLKRGIEPDILVGTSAGALNAAYLAAHPGLQGVAGLAQVWAQVSQANVYPGGRLTALWHLLRTRESLYSNLNFRRFLETHVPAGVRRFGDIQDVRLYIVAARLETGELRLFGDDPNDLILDALMSSTAIPPFWPPWRCQDGELCIDGGVVADLPVGVALEKGAREIYALHTMAGPEEPHVPDNAWGISQQAITAMLSRQREVEMQWVAQQRDVRLHYVQLIPPRELSFWDFSHAAELIEAGYRQAAASLRAWEPGSPGAQVRMP
ncbi:MAG: patatin-like phospholipase family protein [Anaerolineae bacterium]